MPYQLSALAADDLDAIIAEAARLNLRWATRLDADFEHLFELLGQNPGMGKQRTDLTPAPYRFKVLDRDWLIAYTDVPTGHMVTIIRVLAATRDLKALFAEE